MRITLRLFLLPAVITMVAGFQASKVVPLTTFRSIASTSSQTSTTTIELSNKKSTNENDEDSSQFFLNSHHPSSAWIQTGYKVVSTVMVGWTLAASIAMADIDLSATTIDESSMLMQQQPVVVTAAPVPQRQQQPEELYVSADESTAISESYTEVMSLDSEEVKPSDLSEEPTMTLSALGGNVDIVDFSLPSYGDSVSSDTKKVAPSFNPFSDFTPEIVSGGDNIKAAREEKAAADAAKADEQAVAKADAEARKAEDRAAKEARRADEKAAADTAKAEKEAADASKKAARQAQIEEQREKQRAAVESQKQLSTPTTKTVDAVSPTVSGFEIPDMPEIKMPDLSAVKMPDMSAVKIPDMSAVKIPDMSAVKMPDMSAIKIPEFTAPKFDMPAMPSGGDGSTSSFNVPKVSLPDVSFSNPFGGSDSGSSSDDGGDLEPQLVRDERAREARQVYLDADTDAKDAETVARAVRATANDKKGLAAKAKDEACKTRPGGKILCLRNPFTSGY